MTLRSQQHARRNCSTLLVFERTAKPTNQGSLL